MGKKILDSYFEEEERQNREQAVEEAMKRASEKQDKTMDYIAFKQERKSFIEDDVKGVTYPPMRPTSRADQLGILSKHTNKKGLRPGEIRMSAIVLESDLRRMRYICFKMEKPMKVILGDAIADYIERYERIHGAITDEML